MPISTYAELATAVNSFSSRPDRSGDIDTYIALAEEAIYNGIGDIRPLRVQGMVASTSAGLPTIPTDFLEAIRLTTTQSGIRTVLTYLPTQNLAALTGDSSTAQYFTIVGDQIETGRSTIVDYVLDYYKRFAALSGTATTNWILTNAPGIYLHGCLMALYKMTRDQTGEQSAMRDFAASMTALKNRDYQARTRGSILQVRAN
jgi:hypothetical protein